MLCIILRMEQSVQEVAMVKKQLVLAIIVLIKYILGKGVHKIEEVPYQVSMCIARKSTFQ